MLFVETRIADRNVDARSRISLLEALQDRGLVPLIRSSRLYCFEQALVGGERARELEGLVSTWSETEGDVPYVRGDVFCFEDFAHFLIFGDAGDGEQGLRAGIIYGPETDEPVQKLDAFCRNVQEALETPARSVSASAGSAASAARRSPTNAQRNW
ncbi:MAG: hypothetical protein LC754_06940 [Acidobacteria bacterium]|nr:hypothetical protein [Acidobacteriota bacterium]